jgi:glycerophosphoryl diester phosphodiesterase
VLWLQETADGELVVLHDFDLLRAFPNSGPNVAVYQQLAQHGIRPPPASVQVQVGSDRICCRWC